MIGHIYVISKNTFIDVTGIGLVLMCLDNHFSYITRNRSNLQMFR